MLYAKRVQLLKLVDVIFQVKTLPSIHPLPKTNCMFLDFGTRTQGEHTWDIKRLNKGQSELDVGYLKRYTCCSGVASLQTYYMSDKREFNVAENHFILLLVCLVQLFGGFRITEN